MQKEECHHIWNDTVQPWQPRTCRRCLKCGAIFRDMEHYIIILTKDIPIESIIDFGTGKKGVTASYYWRNIQHIRWGYACDVWVIKQMPFWIPLKINALNILTVLKPKSVDVIQAFGFLEHLTKKEGLKFLQIAETLAKKLVVISAATCIHAIDQECGDDPDYKVKIDGNPYHRYNSTWQWKEFEQLGYETNWKDHLKGESFKTEAIAWKKLSL